MSRRFDGSSSSRRSSFSVSCSHSQQISGTTRESSAHWSIVPFAASAADDTESLQALQALVASGESVILLQADAIALPAELAAISTASGVQMVLEVPLQAVSDERVQQLTQDDAAEMLALASLTKPGPFTLRALSLGDFWGIKVDGRLAAMAGERMKQPGYSELSGVCSHPEFRGRGCSLIVP